MKSVKRECRTGVMYARCFLVKFQGQLTFNDDMDVWRV